MNLHDIITKKMLENMNPHTYSFGTQSKKSNKSVQRFLNADYDPPPLQKKPRKYKIKVLYLLFTAA